jgi:hypothetical protein
MSEEGELTHRYDRAYGAWLVLRIVVLAGAAVALIYAALPLSDATKLPALVTTAILALVAAVLDLWIRRLRRRDPRYADQYLMDMPYSDPGTVSAFALLAQLGHAVADSTAAHLWLAVPGVAAVLLNLLSARLYVRRRAD